MCHFVQCMKDYNLPMVPLSQILGKKILEIAQDFSTSSINYIYWYQPINPQIY